MLDAARRVGDVGEIRERVVVDVVVVAVIADRAVGAVERTRAFVLLVGFPRDSAASSRLTRWLPVLWAFCDGSLSSKIPKFVPASSHRQLGRLGCMLGGL